MVSSVFSDGSTISTSCEDGIHQGYFFFTPSMVDSSPAPPAVCPLEASSGSILPTFLPTSYITLSIQLNGDMTSLNSYPRTQLGSILRSPCTSDDGYSQRYCNHQLQASPTMRSNETEKTNGPIMVYRGMNSNPMRSIMELWACAPRA